MDQSHKKSGFVRWALIIGIVIVLNLFFNYAISLIYPAPEYQKFCPISQTATVPATKQDCLAVGGQWNESTYVQETTSTSATPTPTPSRVTATPPSKLTQVNSYCDATYTCGNKFTVANTNYERSVFITLVILGVLSLLFGLFLKVTDVVSIALSFGGVLSLIIASARYWSAAENAVKVGILAVALIALIWVGIKKFS